MVALLIELISSSESLHSYAVYQLWLELEGDLVSKQPLVQVSMWSIGEFADLLVQSNNSESLDGETIDGRQIIEKCEEVLSNNHVTLITQEYTLNALTKLSVRFPSESAHVKQIVDLFGCSHSIELQQRAVEFTTLFSRHDTLRPNVLEKMPQMTRRERTLDAENGGEQNAETEPLAATSNGDSVIMNSSSALLDLLDLSPSHNSDAKALHQGGATIDPGAANDVLDLLGSLDGGGGGSNSNSAASVAQQESSAKSNDLNSLDSLFGSVNSNSVQATSTSIPVASTNGTTTTTAGNNLFDIASFPLESAAKSEMETIPPITAYDKNGLRLEFQFEKAADNPSLIVITLIASNSNPLPIEDFLFQAAVPKVELFLLLINVANFLITIFQFF